MNTEIERRLTAALRAAESAIGEPASKLADVSVAHRQPLRDLGDRRRWRHGRHASWLLPLTASATVLLAVTSSILLVRGNSGSQASPAMTKPSPLATVAFSSTAPAPSTVPTSPAEPQIRAGVDIVAAGLSAGGTGYGYALTDAALLTTTNYGASWHSATPAGVSPGRVATAEVRLLDDGELWLALASETSAEVTVDLYCRLTPTSEWTHTVVRVPSLKPLLQSSASVALDFTDRVHGWMLVGTHSTPNSGASALLRSVDGGTSWTPVAARSVVPALGVIRFSQSGAGILFAAWTASAWVSRDEGATWSSLALVVPPGKRADTATPVGPPVITGNTILLAASFSRPDGTPDGAGVYRSVDGAATWTVTTVALRSDTNSYVLGGAGSGLSVLLATGSGRWWTARSSDDGLTYTNRGSTVEQAGPRMLSVTDAGHLWALAADNECPSGEAQCISRTPLLSSTNLGRSWFELQPKP